uniref:aspartate--tRNA ligase n=1 Tax=Chrysotila carterae TaxID=13221 RepID=A0A7S4BYA0_CHRCT
MTLSPCDARHAQVRGELREAEVLSCSQNNVEIYIKSVTLISAAKPRLPFEIDAAGRSEAVIDASELTGRPFPRVGQDLRLNNRWIDLRAPANNAIMVVQSQTCALFREALASQGFIELHTPKLVAGESEGGAGVFRTDYFGSPACLAQSPQLYKQMAIAADMDRVFEIGPVFRAENSNTRRHLCEFTGLDMEMAFNHHYMEVIRVLHVMFTSLFDGLESRCTLELAAVRTQYPSAAPRLTAEPCVVHWEEAMDMLRDAGESVSGLDDLSTPHERLLGKLVADKYQTDLYFLDRFPTAVRPFYTMPCPDNADYSNSYDIFLRGEEICSGAQRIHDARMLSDAIKARGLPLEPLSAYIDSMRYGMPPHGGAGIGLERLVFLYLNLDNVRKASMFPRDPNRCSP